MKYTYEFLRKCHGLRFKAHYGDDIEGIIKVEKDGVALCYGEEALDKFDYFHREYSVRLDSETSLEWRGITGFEIVPRDPETYKDWQVGDKIIERDLEHSIIFRCGEVALYKNFRGSCCNTPYTCEELYNLGYRLVLTDIEKQILEVQKWEPKDGDIVSWGVKEVDKHPAITIYKDGHWGYFTLFANGKTTLNRENDGTLAFDNIRPATEGEKQQLFDALATKGKRWNVDEKCIEDIPKPHEFHEYDPVLVRDDDSQIWSLQAFKRYKEGDVCPYVCKSGLAWVQCIPYNRDTAKLLNTSNPYTLNR